MSSRSSSPSGRPQGRPDAGRVSLLGGDPWHEAAELHQRLAYVPGDVDLWPGLSGGEVIDLLGRLRGGLDPARRAQLLEDFELDPARKARTYSKGNRQKVALVAALASDVELYVMDEPTAGLDPLMEQVFQQVVHERRAEGTTVLLSSHLLGEVENTVDRLLVIGAGRIVADGPIRELLAGGGTAVRALDPASFAAAVSAAGLEVQQRDGDVLVVPGAAPDRIGALAAAGGHVLVDLRPSEKGLEDLFFQLTTTS